MEGWWEVVGCPYCQSALQPGDSEGLSLRCLGCAYQFPVRGRIPVLLRGEDTPRLTQFSNHYRRARLEEGWRPISPEQALALPYILPPGYPVLYWEVRRRGYLALTRYLGEEGPSPDAGPVADMGAGIG